MDQYFTKHSKSLQNGLYWSFGFLFCFFFFWFFFLFFLQTYTVWSQDGGVGKGLDLTPHLPKFTSVQKKKKESYRPGLWFLY